MVDSYLFYHPFFCQVFSEALNDVWDVYVDFPTTLDNLVFVGSTCAGEGSCVRGNPTSVIVPS